MGGSFDSHPHNIGNLLGQYETRKIVVPQFQRGFSWEKTHLATFWEDLMSFRQTAARGDTYFLGPIVLLPGKDETIVLDGQQRLATVTILLSVIRETARRIANNQRIQAGHDLARDLQRDLIEKKTKTEFALVLGEIDRVYFMKTVQMDPPEDEPPRLRSHNLIKNARDFLSSSVDQRISGMTPSEAIEELGFIRDQLATAITMVAIEVKSEDDAFSIFETLNDRGLRLSVPDLLLNHLMRQATTDEQKRQVREKWDLMLERMGKRDIDIFLRHMWLSKYGDLKARGLFREIKENLNSNKIKSTDFADDSAIECESYVALLELNAKALGKARPHVAGLVKYLGIGSSLPLLLSGIRCLSAADFVKLCRITVGLAVRHSVFSNLNPADLENAFYTAARAIRQKHAAQANSRQCLSHARAILSKNNPTDEQVEAGSDALLLGRSQAQYLVTSIANETQSATKEVALDDANLEHIFPLHPSPNWIDTGKLEPYKWHLGNLTILSTRLNRAAGSDGFDVKKKLYAKSEIKLTSKLVGLTKWDKDEIIKRAHEMSKLANRIWSLS
jgi:hypothetical protein